VDDLDDGQEMPTGRNALRKSRKGTLLRWCEELGIVVTTKESKDELVDKLLVAQENKKTP
jgi:hypothetical protein